MVLSSMQLQKVSVALWFRRIQRFVLRSLLSVFINLRSLECVCSCVQPAFFRVCVFRDDYYPYCLDNNHLSSD